MASNKYNTRYLTIKFMDRLSRDDLVVFYRIIKECKLAEVQKLKESIDEDLNDDIRRFQFVVHDPIDPSFSHVKHLLKILIPVDYVCRNTTLPDQEFKEYWLGPRKNTGIEEEEKMPMNAEVPDPNEAIRRLNIRMCSLEEIIRQEV